jgi:hypothetical protein
MWKNRHRKHCSDEILMAHLDGELLRRIEDSTRRHLLGCWDCRARLSEFEAQAEELTRLSAEPGFPGPERIAAARQKTRLLQEHFERSLLLPTPQFRFISQLGLRPIVAFAGVLVFSLMVLIILPKFPQPGIHPNEVLTRSRQVEEAFYRPQRENPTTGQTASAPVVHQSFRVEVQPLRPAEPDRVSHLQVWSEPMSGRFASRWQESGGKLRSALWRPQQGREYFYEDIAQPGSSRTSLRIERRPVPTTVKWVSLADLSRFGMEPEQIEEGFLQWLESRRWSPILLTSDFSVFCSQEGVTVRAERRTDGNQPPVIRLTAERMRNGIWVQLILDVDVKSLRPRLQAIRLETSEKAVELRLVVEQAEWVGPLQPEAAIFEPDPRWVSADTHPQPVTGDRHPIPETDNSEEIAALELDALHRLDQIGAVLGEQVSLARTPEGKLQVSAVVETDERKEEILQALGPIRSNRAVRMDVRTVKEALQEPLPSPSGPLVLHELEMGKEPTQLEAELRRYFENESPSTEEASRNTPSPPPEAKVRRFAKEMLEHSQEALLHAWALKHIVELFSPQEIQSLSPDLQSKWHSLIQAHARGVQQETGLLRRGLEPIFFAGTVPSEPKDKGETDLTRQGALTSAVERLLQMTVAHDEAIRAAFVISAESRTLDHIKSPEFWQSLRISEKLADKILEQ